MRISVSLSTNLWSLGSFDILLFFLGGIFSAVRRLFGCVVLRKCFPFLFGCPVRVSDMPAHNAVAPEEWLLPHDSIDDWVDAIVEISTKDGRRQPNKMALKRAQKFSIEHWSTSIADAWNQF